MKLLTDGEVTLLARFAKGNTNATVAAELGISEAISNNDMLVIRRKLGAKNTPHAVYLAMQSGELS